MNLTLNQLKAKTTQFEHFKFRFSNNNSVVNFACLASNKRVVKILRESNEHSSDILLQGQKVWFGTLAEAIKRPRPNQKFKATEPLMIFGVREEHNSEQVLEMLSKYIGEVSDVKSFKRVSKANNKSFFKVFMTKDQMQRFQAYEENHSSPYRISGVEVFCREYVPHPVSPRSTQTVVPPPVYSQNFKQALAGAAQKGVSEERLVQLLQQERKVNEAKLEQTVQSGFQKLQADIRKELQESLAELNRCWQKNFIEWTNSCEKRMSSNFKEMRESIPSMTLPPMVANDDVSYDENSVGNPKQPLSSAGHKSNKHQKTNDGSGNIMDYSNSTGTSSRGQKAQFTAEGANWGDDDSEEEGLPKTSVTGTKGVLRNQPSKKGHP
jgi:hypothetical protein